MYFLDTCNSMVVIRTAMIKVLTPVPQIFFYFIGHMDDIILSMEVLRNQQKNPERKCAIWWWPSTVWYQGVCMHIEDQAWVVHLIVYGTDTWIGNNCAK